MKTNESGRILATGGSLVLVSLTYAPTAASASSLQHIEQALTLRGTTTVMACF
jgi:hypothetical protein